MVRSRGHAASAGFQLSLGDLLALVVTATSYRLGTRLGLGRPEDDKCCRRENCRDNKTEAEIIHCFLASLSLLNYNSNGL